MLPLLYLHGLSSKDFVPALEGFFGTDAGLSAATVTRLTVQWRDDARRFAQRDLSSVDYVYLWADGIHVNIRLDEEKLCLLVLIGVRADDTKELVALADGYRESTGSWADLLRDAKRRGMRAPVLAVGDGALGFWGALREVFPETKEQRCWFHKIGNVLSAMPKSAHLGAKLGIASSRGRHPEPGQRALREARAAQSIWPSWTGQSARSGARGGSGWSPRVPKASCGLRQTGTAVGWRTHSPSTPPSSACPFGSPPPSVLIQAGVEPALSGAARRQGSVLASATATGRPARRATATTRRRQHGHRRPRRRGLTTPGSSRLRDST